MDPVQIHVSVELNLSQDAKNFLASLVGNCIQASVAASAPVAPVVPISIPAVPAASAPVVSTPASAPSPAPVTPPATPATPAAPTIEQVRQALAAKVNGHREEIKAKLNSLGAPSVTKLDPAKYSEMYNFLNALS